MFLVVQCDQYVCGFGVLGVDDLYYFVDCGVGGDYVVDDQYLVVQQCVDQCVVFVVVFGFFVVEVLGQVVLVLFGEGYCGGGGQGNVFVGWVEQDVEVDFVVDYCFGVEVFQVGQCQVVVEQVGIEEIGVGVFGFEGEFIEVQNFVFDGEMNEIVLICLYE